MIVFAYITAPDRAEAQSIAKHLISKKLAACANLFDIESIYPWEGKVEEGKEIVLIVKTTEDKFAALEKEILSIHSYDCPCVLKIRVDATNEAYSSWLKANLS